MSEPKGEAFWRRVVGEVEGGRSSSDVAHRHGVSVSSVVRWRGKLRASSVTAIVPVRVTGDAGRRVEVHVGGVRLVFEEGTEPSYVAAVARAFGA
ncbi:MAG: transposase [Gaiellaceae bacterium]